MNYHPRKPPSNEDRIIKHRLYEDCLRDRLVSVHNYEHLMRRAEFEQANEPKTCYRSLSEKLQAIRTERGQATQERRKRLIQFLRDEDDSLEEELKKGSMNLTERRAWLEAEAVRLRTERLKRMQNYADEQLDRAFCESSDDVRIYNSKLAVMVAEEERKKQREENIRRRYQQKEEEESLYKKMEAEWDRQNALHRQELERDKAGKQEAFDILQEQLAMIQRLREEEKAAIQEDMRRMNQKWQEEEAALKHRQYEQRCLDAQKAKEMLCYNEHNQLSKLAEAEEEKRYDSCLIAMVNEREAEEERQEKALREAQRREARVYAEQLKEAIDRQKVEDEELEAMVKAELDEEWRKKDEEMQRQESLRRSLLNQVHVERQEQLQFKETLLKEQEEMKKRELEKHLADAELASLEDLKRAEDVKMSKQDVMTYLESQIRNKQATELFDKEMQRADFEGTKMQEKNYEVKVKKALATTLPYPEPYYGRKAVKWYY